MWTHRQIGRGRPGAPEEQPNGRVSVWIWIERSLLAFGLLLLALYGAIRIQNLVNSRAALDKFAALESSQTSNTVKSGENAGAPEDAGSSREIVLPNLDFSLWGARRLQAYKEALGAENRVPLGVLRIPTIRLEAPLFDGTDDATLNYAVGRIAGTARPGEPGNIAIAGHRDGFFRGLKDVRVGDAIELRTPQGTDTYVVDRLQIVSPKDVSVLRPTDVPSLTLVTCYPFYFVGSAPQRYIVTASLTREIQGGAENSVLSLPSAASSSTRRNHEQDE
jgi:sortase A